MLSWLWKFVRNGKNREIVSWLGGGAVAIVVGTFSLFTYLFPHDDKKTAAQTAPIVNQYGSVNAPGGIFNGPVSVGIDEKKNAEQIVIAQRPLTEQLEKLATQVARDRGVDIAPLRAILVKLGEVGVRDEDIPKVLNQKADELKSFAALRTLNISVTENDGKPFAKFGWNATDATMTSALPYLVLLGVSDLNLSNSGLTTLPSLDGLTALKTLRLTATWLTTLPSLDRLTALETLDLSASELTTLPSLDGLTALKTLDLRGTQVTTLPSLDRLSALKTLDLPNTQVTTLPPLHGLTALETLDLANSELTTLPSLDGLSALKTLDLRGTQVTTLPSLDGLAALETLDLSDTRLTILPSLDRLTALKTLDLGRTKVTTLPSLDRLTALTELRLGSLVTLLNGATLNKLTARGVTIYGPDGNSNR
jgi:hypothetical protein